MATETVFKNELDKNYFQWQHMPYAGRIHWNHLLKRVVDIDTKKAGGTNDFIMDDRFGDELENETADAVVPNFYNQDFCLALTLCPEQQQDNGADNNNRIDLRDSSGQGLQAARLALDNAFRLPDRTCWDVEAVNLLDLYPYLIKPHFNYHRKSFDLIKFGAGSGGGTSIEKLAGYNLQSLTVGSLVWLYFYERMGIFKILAVLLDDYNHRGKYAFSSQIRNGVQKNKQYVELLEHLSILSRQGLASTLRDRVSTYQRVLGVTVQNDLNVQSTENSPFMKNFSKLISNMLEYYNAKRLAVAIQNNNQTRSSVASQTAILNTIKVLCQNFEVMEYGRNMVHTFTGIATVYATLSLIKQIRDVIGIPREYDAPEEYIPAAYDILVLKKQGTPNDANRYTIFDNCASYGYRILTDVQLANLSSFRLGESNTAFDAWLSSVEEWVEGYNNAFRSISDKANAGNGLMYAG